MSVTRINEEGLHKILHNQVLSPVTCVIKFYSNSCNLCHSLQEYYTDISDEFSSEKDMHFYAFNVQDDPSIEKTLKFRGVPTIVIVKPDPEMSSRRMSAHKVMPEPENPHEKTWFRSKEIRDFIVKEKR